MSFLASLEGSLHLPALSCMAPVWFSTSHPDVVCESMRRLSMLPKRTRCMGGSQDMNVLLCWTLFDLSVGDVILAELFGWQTSSAYVASDPPPYSRHLCPPKTSTLPSARVDSETRSASVRRHLHILRQRHAGRLRP